MLSVVLLLIRNVRWLTSRSLAMIADSLRGPYSGNGIVSPAMHFMSCPPPSQLGGYVPRESINKQLKLIYTI
jgi:hypothetical protein